MKLNPLAIALAVSAVLTASVGCEGGRSTRRPEAVFLIVVDTLRPDRLSCYGCASHETPSIDAIARRGVRFANAHSPASWTVPSMGAIMTSLYPTQLGMVEVDAKPGEMLEWRVPRRQKSHQIPDDIETLAERMQSAGFESAAFVNQPALNVLNRFTRGFDAWFYPDSAGVVRHDTDVPIPGRPNWQKTTARAFEADSALVGAFRAWLADEAGPGHFAWLHLLTPHAPYLPPARYAPAEVTAGTLYDGEVRAVDALVGQIVDAIDEVYSEGDALIVFVSDHGEAFGEHGMHEHGHTLHREVTRVPMILAGAGLRAGTVIDRHVSALDIMPTVLGLIEDPAAPLAMEGRNLLMPDDEGSEPLIYAEGMLYGNTERSLLIGEMRVMFNGMNGRFALFDIEADPTEESDVSAGHTELAGRMQAALVAMHARLQADFDRRHDPEAPVDSDADEALLEALRSLGYIK